MVKLNIPVKRAGNNIVVDTKNLKHFMYVFFEMDEVKHSAFECGIGDPYIVFSYHKTEDFIIVRCGYQKSVILNVFGELEYLNPSVFGDMKNDIVYWI